MQLESLANCSSWSFRSVSGVRMSTDVGAPQPRSVLSEPLICTRHVSHLPVLLGIAPMLHQACTTIAFQRML